MIEQAYSKLTNGKNYSCRIFPYRILDTGRRIYQTDIMDAVVTSSPVDQMPLSRLETGAVLRDSSSGTARHYTIIDTNHEGMPHGSYQLLMNDRVIVTISKNGYSLDKGWEIISNNLKKNALEMEYETLFETVKRYTGTATTKVDSAVTKSKATSKIIIPSIYELNLEHSGQKIIDEANWDGHPFEWFYASMNREYDVPWFARSVFVNDTIYNEYNQVISHKMIIPRIYTDGERSPVSFNYSDGSINLAARCIISVMPETINLYASPDKDGVYSMMWPVE